jgi:hypothetical protein
MSKYFFHAFFSLIWCRKMLQNKVQVHPTQRSQLHEVFIYMCDELQLASSCNIRTIRNTGGVAQWAKPLDAWFWTQTWIPYTGGVASRGHTTSSVTAVVWGSVTRTLKATSKMLHISDFSPVWCRTNSKNMIQKAK